MRVRDIVVPFLTGVLIFSINVAVNSCASQGRTDDDQAADNAAVSGAKNDELSALGDIPPEGVSAEAAPPEGGDGTQPLDASNIPPPPPADGTESAPSELTDNNPPPPSDLAPLENGDANAPVEKTPVSRSGYTGGGGGGFHAPKIPAEAIRRRKDLLNRFYFARRGDTPKKVATLVYGDKKRAKDLSRWNGGGWTPGKVLYYQSPAQPDDPAMKSFYQERNVPTEEYLVKKGDWLSRIAAKRLGNVRSWKEIAVTNGIDDPRKLEPGQKLAVYPKDLSTFGATGGGAPPRPQVADNQQVQRDEPPPRVEPTARPTQPPAQAGVPPVDTAPLNNEPPNGGGNPNGFAATPPGDTAPAPGDTPAFLRKKKKSVTEGFDFMSILDQNLLFIAVGVLLLVLLIALAIVNRRKKANSEDFADDSFATKARRR